MRRLALLVAILSALPAAAQSVLVVETDGAWVSVMAAGGTTALASPGAVVALPPGEATVVAVDDAAAWNPRRAETAVVLVAGDTLRVSLPLPVRYRVESVPLGAALTVDGRPAGTTPATLDLPRGARATLVARLDGHADATTDLAGDGGEIGLVLRPTAPGAPAVVLLPTQRSPRTRTLIDLGVGALAVAAGAVAVHYKFRADALDDRYRDPDGPDFGDETLRTEAEALDVRSGVALGVMQAGLVGLAVRFLLR